MHIRLHIIFRYYKQISKSITTCLIDTRILSLRSLNYPAAESEFHSPANWMLGQRLTNHLYSQQHRLQNQQQNHSRPIPRDMRYPTTNKSLKGSSQYGLISFGPRGGYNSGGTSGSGSSSQDAQKSPASRTSSKISYDSTGPHDERYYGNVSFTYSI